MTSWNLTIPDTSPQIEYESFLQICPNVGANNLAICDSNSAHISNATTASITIEFVGSAIYLFGNSSSGVRYSTTLDFGDAENGTVSGNLLASYTGLTNMRNDVTSHQIQLNTQQFVEGSVLTFTSAIISVDAGVKNPQLVVTTYNATDPAINFTPGWTKNGTYMQSGTQLAQQATLSFTGSAVLVKGECGSHLDSDEFGTDAFGSVTVDQGESAFISPSGSTLFGGPSYVTQNCLMYWNTGLTEGPHNLTLNSQENDMVISSIQVLSVSGSSGSGSVSTVKSGGPATGSTGGFSAPSPGSVPSGGSSGGSTPTTSSSGFHLSAAAIAGIAIGLSVLVTLFGWYRRYQRQRQFRRAAQPLPAPVQPVTRAPTSARLAKVPPSSTEMSTLPSRPPTAPSDSAYSTTYPPSSPPSTVASPNPFFPPAPQAQWQQPFAPPQPAQFAAQQQSPYTQPQPSPFTQPQQAPFMTPAGQFQPNPFAPPMGQFTQPQGGQYGQPQGAYLHPTQQFAPGVGEIGPGPHRSVLTADGLHHTPLPDSAKLRQEYRPQRAQSTLRGPERTPMLEPSGSQSQGPSSSSSSAPAPAPAPLPQPAHSRALSDDAAPEAPPPMYSESAQP